MNVSCGIVWDCIGLTSFNRLDTQIDQCWPDPMIPGYFHIPSRHECHAHIIIPKLAGSGLLAGWLARWLASGGCLDAWLARWLRQLLLLVEWLAIGLRGWLGS